MDFGATISRALKISWQHKSLWVIALLPLIAALAVVIPYFAVFLGSFVASFTAGGPTGIERDVGGMLGAGLLAANCLLFVGEIAIIVLSLVSQGALIEGVRQAEDEGRVQLGAAMRVGWQNAGKLFVSGLLIALPILAIVCVGLIGVIGVAISSGGGDLGRGRSEDALAALFSGGVCVVLALYCVIIIYAIVASGAYVLGQRAIVLNNAGPLEGLRRGWQLFRANLGSIILLALLLVGIGLIVSLVMQFGLSFGMLPAFSQLSGLGANARPEDVSRVLSGLFIASFGVTTIIVFILNMIWTLLFSIFTSVVWTLAYRQFAGGSTGNLNSPPPAIPELR